MGGIKHQNDAKPIDGTHQCEALIYEAPWYIHSHRCSRRAKFIRSNYKLCGQHARQPITQVS